MKRAKANKHWNEDRRYFRASLVVSCGSVDRIHGIVCDECVELCAEEGIRIPRSMRELASVVTEGRRRNIAANRGLGYTPLSEAFDRAHVRQRSRRLAEVRLGVFTENRSE